MTAYVVDCETSGKEPQEVVEFSALRFELSPDGMSAICGELVFDNVWFQPVRGMSFGAMAVHHIMPSFVDRCPPSSEAKLPTDAEYIIGHNVDFDWAALGSPDVKRICTLAMARRIWPEADSHSLVALNYMLGGESVRFEVMEAHQATADCSLVARLLNAILLKLPERGHAVESMEKLWKLSEAARVPTHMTFGKHKGMAIAELPHDYRSWLLRQDDLCPYLKKALDSVRR